ncbi:unnamed protein product [Amoebophrya sp. A25]|nr:unnamed protein product [Amoebophrya sp. A25]|eukprot:GSA25T00014469001.1
MDVAPVGGSLPGGGQLQGSVPSSASQTSEIVPTAQVHQDGLELINNAASSGSTIPPTSSISAAPGGGATTTSSAASSRSSTSGSTTTAASKTSTTLDDVHHVLGTTTIASTASTPSAVSSATNVLVAGTLQDGATAKPLAVPVSVNQEDLRQNLASGAVGNRDGGAAERQIQCIANVALLSSIVVMLSPASFFYRLLMTRGESLRDVKQQVIILLPYLLLWVSVMKRTIRDVLVIHILLFMVITHHTMFRGTSGHPHVGRSMQTLVPAYLHQGNYNVVINNNIKF